MKFAIITHVEHKIKANEIFAYEPYAREMNLWLKYVDEVLIVAPISKEKVTSIESKYLFNSRHSALDSESHDLKMKEQIATSQTPRNCELIKLTKIPSFNVISLKNGINAIFKIPKICIQIYNAMQWADHIHLRCPGNIGLLGCFVQILFPNKAKTVKYAGNWDPKSKQPLSYGLQKWILSNTFLTRNTKVFVYGKWPNQTKNIIPFFTATYSEKEITERHNEQSEAILSNKQIASSPTPRNDGTQCHSVLDAKSNNLKTDEQMLKQVQLDENECHSKQSEAILSNKQIATSPTPRNDGTQCHSVLDAKSNNSSISFLFAGALTKGKQPLLSVKVVHKLKMKGYNVQLNIYGDGSERKSIENYIRDYKLQNEVILHGNVSREIVKSAYQKSHFLLFISKSEGWPKVVAEAMFWGCLPISSNVSCIPYMLGNGSRGAIVKPEVKEIVLVIENYLNHKDKYQEQTEKAMEWSRQYTLERFEEEIGKLL